MQLLTPITLFIFSFACQATPTAEGELAAAPEANVKPGLSPWVEHSLEKKACVYNGCKCNSRGGQLTVCGNCYWTDLGTYVVTEKRVANHIYECSPSGACCDYGVGNDCGKAGARCKVNP